jgi:MFS family permease
MTLKPMLSVHYAWIVLAMGTLAVFGALGLARFGYTMVLPDMQKSLAMDNAQAGLLATVNLAGYLILSMIGGALASRYGARAVATLGLVLAGIGMIFTGLAPDFLFLAIWRGLTGIGSGAGNIAVMGLWAAWFSQKKRGLASGIAVSGSSIALILTGIAVPGIIAGYGADAWRLCWLGYGVITLILAAGSFLFIRNNPTELELQPVEVKSNLPLVMEPVPLERIQWRRVYGSAPVWHLGVVYIAFGFSYIIYMTFFSKYLMSSGYTQAAAGNLFMAMGWFSLLCGLLWGSVSDRIGRKNTLIILYLIHMIAFALFAIGKSPLPFTISAILFGISAWSIPAIMAAACGDALGPKLAPAALGFITLFFGIGQAAGPYAAGAIADAKGSFGPVFLLASVIAFLGAIGSATLKTPDRK